MPGRFSSRWGLRAAVVLLAGLAVVGGAVTAASAANAGAVAGTAAPGAVGPSVGLLSQNRPVTASSSGGCCPAKNAVDGRSSTRWASAAGVDPQWIYVDLGRIDVVSRVRLEWDLSCATAYQLQTSRDTTTWTTVYTVTAGDGGVDDVALPANPYGRYVRVYGTHRCRTSSSKGYSLREVQVFGYPLVIEVPPPPPQDVHANPGCLSITITWIYPDLPYLDGFEIYRDGQLVARTPATSRSATIYAPTGGISYQFTILAVDILGNVSQPSDTVEVVTPICDPVILQPPTDLHPVQIDATCVTLAWTEPPSSVFVVQYRVYSNGFPVWSTPYNTTRICGLAPNTTYFFSVTSVGAGGNESDRSNAVAVTTRTA
jgi:hypothetical protein